MKNNRRNPGEAALGGVTSSRPNSRSDAVGDHPGATDRMVGGDQRSENGVSHPWAAGLISPRKRGRRRRAG
jgi:hypothetical protein